MPAGAPPFFAVLLDGSRQQRPMGFGPYALLIEKQLMPEVLRQRP